MGLMAWEGLIRFMTEACLSSFCWFQVLLSLFLVCQGFENTQSSVRKATVVCLVAIYLCVGEELRPYLKGLNGSKVRLLDDSLDCGLQHVYLS